MLTPVREHWPWSVWLGRGAPLRRSSPQGRVLKEHQVFISCPDSKAVTRWSSDKRLPTNQVYVPRCFWSRPGPCHFLVSGWTLKVPLIHLCLWDGLVWSLWSFLWVDCAQETWQARDIYEISSILRVMKGKIEQLFSFSALWVNPEQAIFHQSVGWCTHPSVPLIICGAVPCTTKLSPRLSCPPATGWDCARNHRRRTTGRKFSGVVLRKMKILAECLKKYCCGFVDRHRLPGWDGSLPAVPMQVWVPSAQVLFCGCSAHCMMPCSLKSWGVLYAQSVCTFIFAL